MIIIFSSGPKTTYFTVCIGSFHFLFTPLETLDNAVILTCSSLLAKDGQNRE